MVSILIGIGALLGVGGVGALMAYRNRQARDERIRRVFTMTPTVSIADARDGQWVVVAGTVDCTEPLRAPITGRPCAACEVLSEHCRDGSVWVETKRLVYSTDFTLTDAGGEAIVQVGRAEILSVREHEEWDENDVWRRREGAAELGELVAVYGRGNWEPDPRPDAVGAGYRDRPTVLVIRGDRRHPVLITTSPPLLKPVSR